MFVFLKLWESWNCLDGVNEFEERNLAFGFGVYEGSPIGIFKKNFTSSNILVKNYCLKSYCQAVIFAKMVGSF